MDPATPLANSISDAVRQALASAPDAGSHGAFYLEATTADGVHGVLAARVGDHVQVAAIGGLDVDRHLEGGVAARVVW